MKRRFSPHCVALLSALACLVASPASAEAPDKAPRPLAKFPAKFYHFMGAPVAMAVGLFYTVEDIRGAMVWDRYLAEAKQRGAQVWLRDVVSPPIPDAENLLAIPAIQERFRTAPGKEAPGAEFPKPLKAPEYFGDFSVLRRADLTKIRDAMVKAGQLAEPGPDAARDVLAALAKHVPILEQLRDAAPRPGYYYPLQWEKRMSMINYHFVPVHAAVLALQSSIHAHLALGERAAALRDWLLLFRLIESYDGHSEMVGGLLSTIHTQQFLTVLWDGCAAHRWTDVELAAIEKKLRSLNFIARCRRVLAIERGQSLAELDAIYQLPLEKYSSAVDFSGQGNPKGAMPRGWLRLNMTLISRWFDAAIAQIEPVDGRERASFPEFIQVDQWLDQELGTAMWRRMPYALSLMMLPNTKDFVDRFLATEMSVRQARLACALERHYLKHRAYPETLAALVPAYLPEIPGDVFDGQPMRYRREADGGYTLWSIGINRVDDGGKPEVSPNRPPLDGVWKMPVQ